MLLGSDGEDGNSSVRCQEDGFWEISSWGLQTEDFLLEPHAAEVVRYLPLVCYKDIYHICKGGVNLFPEAEETNVQYLYMSHSYLHLGQGQTFAHSRLKFESELGMNEFS